jgi:tetratricopeptide (TPR) repeat protein
VGLRRLGDMEGTCIACGAIGAVQLKMGNLDAALDTLIKQLRLAEELNDLAQQAMAMGNLGLTCRSLGRHDEARTWFERQFMVAQSIDDIPGQIQAYGSLSTLFRMLGRHAEAMEMFSKQLQMADNAAPSELVTGQAEVEDDPVCTEDRPEAPADLKQKNSRKAEVEDNPVAEEDGPEVLADLQEVIKARRELTWDEESGAAPPDSDEVLVLKKQKVHVQRAQPQHRPDHRTEGRVRGDNEDGQMCDDATISACHPLAQQETSSGAPSLTDGGKAEPAERKVALMEEEEQMRKAEEDMAKNLRAAERVAQQLVALPLGSACRDQAWARAIAMKEVVFHMAESVESTQPDLAIILFGRLARAYEQSSSPGNVQAAIDLYDKVIKLANKLKMSAVEASSWMLKAEGLMLLRDYESAAKALTRQVDLVERLQDTKAHVNACFKLAGVYSKIGMHVKTLDVLRMLLPLTERLGDMAAQGSALSLMAETLGKIGRFDEASQIRAKSRVVYNQAVQFYTSHLSSREHDKQSTAYSKLAVLYKDLGRHTEAIDMLAKAKATQGCVGASAVEATSSRHPADLPYPFNLHVALDNASHDQVFVCESQAQTCEGGDCGKTDRRSVLGRLPSRPEPVSGPASVSGPTTYVGQEGMPPAEAREEAQKWLMSEQGTEKFDVLPEAWGPKNASALDSQSHEWVECQVDAHMERQVHADMQQEASSGADCSTTPGSDRHRSPQSPCNASLVGQLAGPTPTSSPMHVSYAVVQTHLSLESDEQQQRPVAEDVAVNALVLELLHLCEEEEWEKAAAMQPQMLLLASALPEGDAGIASAIYGNLGFALESLAQAADRQYEASTPLWGEAIAMHQKARHAAIRSPTTAINHSQICSVLMRVVAAVGLG